MAILYQCNKCKEVVDIPRAKWVVGEVGLYSGRSYEKKTLHWCEACGVEVLGFMTMEPLAPPNYETARPKDPPKQSGLMRLLGGGS